MRKRIESGRIKSEKEIKEVAKKFSIDERDPATLNCRKKTQVLNKSNSHDDRRQEKIKRELEGSSLSVAGLLMNNKRDQSKMNYEIVEQIIWERLENSIDFRHAIEGMEEEKREVIIGIGFGETRKETCSRMKISEHKYHKLLKSGRDSLFQVLDYWDYDPENGLPVTHEWPEKIPKEFTPYSGKRIEKNEDRAKAFWKCQRGNLDGILGKHRGVVKQHNLELLHEEIVFNPNIEDDVKTLILDTQKKIKRKGKAIDIKVETIGNNKSIGIYEENINGQWVTSSLDQKEELETMSEKEINFKVTACLIGRSLWLPVPMKFNPIVSHETL